MRSIHCCILLYLLFYYSCVFLLQQWQENLFKVTLNSFLILFSSFSFLFYGVSYFTSTNMKSEFKRFGLEKLGLITAVTELVSALGLLVGLKYPLFLTLFSGVLALLMFSGTLVRIKMKDSLWLMFPAIFYLFLNSYLFFISRS